MTTTAGEYTFIGQPRGDKAGKVLVMAPVRCNDKGTQWLAIMRPANFEIVFRLDAWHFVADDVTSAPYQTQATAIRAAEAFVRGRGIDARVRIYRFDGIAQEERTYSRERAIASDRHA